MRISVIIPTLNEAACIADTLSEIQLDGATELLVVDGGSVDGTCEMAERIARVIRSPRGRGIQLNAGAAAATGDVLLFLHADCRLEPGWSRVVRAAAGRSRFVAGCFQMRIKSAQPIYRAIERGGDLRVRWLGLPYGDQGIFLRRDMFWRLGGFPAEPFMEDLMFMRRARRAGRVELVPHRIWVSARRWERHGAVRQTLRNWVLTWLAVGCGVPPRRLFSFYPDVRGGSGSAASGSGAPSRSRA